MRILVFGESILPPAFMPRIRYFCSFLIKKGWTVDWVIEDSDYKDVIPDKVSLVSIDYYKNKQGVLAKAEWIAKFILNLFYDYKGRYFYKKSKKILLYNEYDVVFCSSSFTFPLITASKTAKRLNIPLFVDLRDIAEQSPDDNHYLAKQPPKIFKNTIVSLYKSINIKRRNRVLKKATGVTTISPWHVQILQKYNPNTHLIYNGFDENKFFPEIKLTDVLSISYFGRVYNEEMRDPRLVFKALLSLISNGKISKEKISINWFTDEESKLVICEIAEKYNLSEIMQYNEFIHPNKLSEEMNQSSILLVLGNKVTNKRYFGIMTTKFFEAIGVNRPIICTPNNNDSLSELVKSSNCGIVSSDPAEIESFILEKFQEWEKNKHTVGSLDDITRMSFSREKGAEKLEKLLLNAIKSTQ